MKRLVKRLLGLIYPAKCCFCRCILPEPGICSHCVLTLPMLQGCLGKREQISACWSVYAYEGKVRESVHRYKFYGQRQYSRQYAHQISGMLLRERVEFDMISWVPISRKRMYTRGYDQAGLLAQGVAKELQVPCLRTLKKVRNTRPQSSLSKKQRHTNIVGVFRAVNTQSFQGKRILLIDDVITSGATLSECRKTLRSAGAAEIVCATLAAVREKKVRI